MSTIREALLKSGFVTGLTAVKLTHKAPTAPRQKRQSRFSSAEIQRELAASKRIPSTSGSVTHEARLVSCVGSDGFRKLKEVRNGALKK